MPSSRTKTLRPRPVSRAKIDERMGRFREKCVAAGLKITHQRSEIFRELAGAEEHPDAETIYTRVRVRVPSISRDTVYRTLSALESQGLISRAVVLFDRGRYDANTDHHHHFICIRCGRIRDFTSSELDDLPIPRAVRTLGVVQSTQIQVRGLCADCQEG